MTQTRAILTDFGGVLTTRSATAREDFAGVFGATLGDYRDAGMRIATRLRLDPVAEVETGRMDEEQFLELLAEELPQAHVRELGVAYYTQHLPNLDVIDAVRRAKAGGVRTALLTNAAVGWTPYWIGTIPEADQVFDAIVVSAAVGHRKPDEGMYAAALAQLGGDLLPQECLFLDDEESNCASAAAFGLQVVHVTEPQTALDAVAAALEGVRT